VVLLIRALQIEDGDTSSNLSFSPRLVEDLFNAISTLQQIRDTHPDVCIAAITNGRGSPLHMSNTLEPFFDFCVIGEDETVFPARKPQAGIYHESLRRYQELYPHHAARNGDNDEQQGSSSSSSSTERVWCHVGDCLANRTGRPVPITWNVMQQENFVLGSYRIGSNRCYGRHNYFVPLVATKS
jgi:hypothetical protein